MINLPSVCHCFVPVPSATPNFVCLLPRRFAQEIVMDRQCSDATVDIRPPPEPHRGRGELCDCGEVLELRRIRHGYLCCSACAGEKVKVMEAALSPRRARLVELSQAYLRTLQPQSESIALDIADAAPELRGKEGAVIGAYWIGTRLYVWHEGEELPSDAVKPVRYSELEGSVG
jgi:hypothetical protein